MGPTKTHAEWSIADDDLDTAMGPTTTRDLENGAGDVQLLDDPADMGKPFEELHGSKTEPPRDRQAKPNKVYIGGLPDHTRTEDLQNCFGKIGNILTIELKLGYGFVEFDTREAAEESIARYNEGYFMGNNIRVEPSHGRGRSYKRSDEPGACFRCGENGHWARECPRPSTQTRGGPYDQPSHERGYSNRDHHHSSREAHSNRDEYSSSRVTHSRSDRFYDTPQAAPPPARERDRRDYDDYRTRNSSPPPAVARQERTRHHASQRENPSNEAPTDRDSYDQHNRRHHAEDRSAQYSMPSGRPRTPPGPPPSWKDEAPRGHHHTQETRRRQPTPLTYSGNVANGSRRRRSLSPTPRYDSRYGGPTHTDGERYSGHARESTRVRDYHRSSRAEDPGHRRS